MRLFAIISIFRRYRHLFVGFDHTFQLSSGEHDDKEDEGPNTLRIILCISGPAVGLACPIVKARCSPLRPKLVYLDLLRFAATDMTTSTRMAPIITASIR